MKCISDCLHRQDLCESFAILRVTVAYPLGQMGWWGDIGGPKQKGIVYYGIRNTGPRLLLLTDSPSCLSIPAESDARGVLGLFLQWL